MTLQDFSSWLKHGLLTRTSKFRCKMLIYWELLIVNLLIFTSYTHCGPFAVKMNWKLLLLLLLIIRLEYLRETCWSGARCREWRACAATTEIFHWKIPNSEIILTDKRSKTEDAILVILMAEVSYNFEMKFFFWLKEFLKVCLILGIGF